MSTEKTQYLLQQKEIQEFLPHRYPFLLVDRILEIKGPSATGEINPNDHVGIKVVGLKNVSMNEPFFTGHFPQRPIMPGVLIIEAMAQVASFAFYPTVIEKVRNHESLECVLVGVDETRFRVPVVPGDQLRIETTVLKCRRTLWSFECKAFVGDKLVAEAKLLANLSSSPTASGEKKT
jgi:3-hydroxyacyl-[acyl-carrier-protein] dehydratase